jgi:filamentous hemagglutinin family protein
MSSIPKCFRPLAGYCLIGTIVFPITPTLAQSVIVPDDTLGVERSIVQPRVDGTLQYDVITGGATRGTGLFHSFTQFNVGDRLNAQFSISPTIQNVFARVTGGDISRIDGFLGTGIDNGTTLVGSTASLFLLNPNGIIFGPNAKLDLAGSFLATTASGFQFAGGQVFSAVNPQAAPLLTVSVPTGLQFGQKVGGIEVNGVKLSTATDAQSLGLIGGNVKITDATLSTISGQLDVGAVGAGESVGLVPLPIGLKVDYAGVKSFQDIQVDRSQINAGAVKVGDFAIFPIDLQLQGRQINITGNSSLFYSYEDVNTKNLIPGKIRLIASDGIEIDNSYIGAGGDGTIATPDVFISTGKLAVKNGRGIFLGRNAAIPGGNITVNARESILIQGSAERRTNLFTISDNTNNVGGGDVKLITPRLSVADGGAIGTIGIQGESKAGNVEIDATEQVNIFGDGLSTSSIYSSVDPEGSGDSGNIQIRTKTLRLDAGGDIILSNFGQGETGQIRIQATDQVIVSGVSKRYGLPSSISNDTNSEIDNPRLTRISTPGIQINTGRLLIADGGLITTRKINDGNVRDILIDVENEIVVRGAVKTTLRNNKQIFLSSSISSDKLDGIGDGGNITLRAKAVQVLDGGNIVANISSSSRNFDAPAAVFQGKAGDITIDASESVLVEGETAEPYDDLNAYASSEISNNVGVGANAQGGRLLIKTADLQVKNGAQITSDVTEKGNAGDLEIFATGNVTVSGIGKGKEKNRGVSNISSSALVGSDGNGGSLTINAASLNLEDGGSILSTTVSSGNAGKITVDVAGDILISGTSANGDLSGISTSSSVFDEVDKARLNELRQLNGKAPFVFTETTGDAGNIQITANSLKVSNSGGISATSKQLGKAGNIKVDLRDRFIVNNGEIRTAADKTSGGNIDLSAKVILLRNNSNIKTQVISGAGNSGSITLTAPSGIVLLEDSDILAFAQDGRGGNITLNTQALLTRTYSPSDPTADRATLDTNGFVDINATGATSGIITLPSLNPLQNNRPELPQGLIDPSNQLSRSCLARNPNTGKFYITGAGGIPPQPGDPSLSNYSTLPVASTATEPTQIVEADGFYPLDNGKFVLGKACQTTEVAS